MEFHGIPRAAFEYFRLLERHNDRDWWHENRALWDDDVHAPLMALASDLHDEFGELSVSRPNRDIRLTRDKRPYRRYAAISRTSAGAPGLYLQIDASGLLVAGGLWTPDRDQLDRFRRAVDDEGTARDLDAVLADLRRRRLPLGDPAALQGAPRGYRTDHPRIDLLRRTRLTVARHWAEAAWMRTAEVRRRVITAWRSAERWNAWLAEHVGGGSIEHSASEQLDR